MRESIHLRNYLDQKLAELGQQKNMNDLVQKGNFSFGIEANNYAHLPAWKDLVQKKKMLVRWIWLDAIFISLAVVGLISIVWERFESNWIKALIYWIVMSAVIMLFYVCSSYFSLFFKFRQTEREVRKLIYQDILYQLSKEENHSGKPVGAVH